MDLDSRNAFFKLITALFFALIMVSCERDPVEVIPRSIRSADDIQRIDTQLVRPYDYVNVISLEDLPVEVKKDKFIDLLLPAILVTRKRHEIDLNRVDSLSKMDDEDIRGKDREFIDQKMDYFDADNLEELKIRMITHPNSIVLAQAALESGWGTSRFFMEANNIFGIHSFDEEHDRVRAGAKRDGKVSWLKSYPSLSGSVEDYFRTLARGPYRDFRIARAGTSDPFTLIRYLENYSIMGESYIDLLDEVIRVNDLTKYDDYRLDPRYLN